MAHAYPDKRHSVNLFCIAHPTSIIRFFPVRLSQKADFEIPSIFMTAPEELRTARLLLRSLEREDVPAMVQLAGENEIAATTLNIPHPYAEHDALNFLEKANEDFRAGRSVSFAISISPGRELRGAIGLTLADMHKHAELGYWIGVQFWGRGYATEAASAVVEFGFGTLHLHRICAHHFAGNTASRRVLEKIGMRHEGRFRQHIRKQDQFIDIENYGVLVEEFRNGVPARRSESRREGG
jgi:ribosomal-protein-alanine N-acetyltransferase